jgi:hypothetical protein
MTVNDDKSVDYGLSGPTSTGEHGTLETCRTLVQALNRLGAEWARPTALSTEQFVDCGITGGGGRKLRIQVVRAVADATFWQKVNRDGQLQESGADVRTLAEAMRNAVLKKAGAIPAEVRGTITLALNAIDLPACASHEVVERFRNEFLPEIRSYGFAAVWVVGPTSQLVSRLD